MTVADEVRGYHKPIMIAGGLGNIREEHVEQRQIAVGSALIVLGGPVMLIWILPAFSGAIQRWSIAARK
jgi:phosphoribosylformylglycinamidine (FGAM) synthase-like enzyme